jgi:hypothetical protein
MKIKEKIFVIDVDRSWTAGTGASRGGACP